MAVLAERFGTSTQGIRMNNWDLAQVFLVNIVNIVYIVCIRGVFSKYSKYSKYSIYTSASARPLRASA
jgi:hypothetical protein